MKKQILNTIGLAVAAALFCVTCSDNGLTKNPNGEAGNANALTGKFYGKDNPPDLCAINPAPACPNYCDVNPTAPGCPEYVDPCKENPTPDCPNYCQTHQDEEQCQNDPCAVNPTPNCPNYCQVHPEDADQCKGDPCAVNPAPDCPNYCEFYPTVPGCRPEQITYTLRIDATSGGTVSPDIGVHSYADGASVTVRATANSGYAFKNWSGASTSTSAAVTIRMDGNKTLTANFQEVIPTTYTLTVSANPPEGGNVTVIGGPDNPEPSTHNPGASVIVRATANDGYAFLNWSAASGSLPSGITATSANITFSINSNVDIMANFQSNDTPQESGTFFDSRSSLTYKWVKIGTQKWMAENLNYHAYDSKCYGDSSANCEIYGRLYNWSTAMGGKPTSSTSPSMVQGVCPDGWHIPSLAEWTTLTDFVGGASTAGAKLKSTEGWNSDGNGSDDYGFAALPGGYGQVNGRFYEVGNRGNWWSATEYNTASARHGSMNNNSGSISIGGAIYISKTYLVSVRCVADAD